MILNELSQQFWKTGIILSYTTKVDQKTKTNIYDFKLYVNNDLFAAVVVEATCNKLAR